MKKLLIAFIGFSLLYFTACQSDNGMSEGTSSELDLQLEQLFLDASGGVGKSAFILPDSDDFASIPQDPKNTITREKVMLGRMLFHETGLGLGAMQDIGKGTYSCASCHFAAAGFQAGRFQGIGEGGIGFGVNGEGRTRNNLYREDQLDVQPIRTPTAMNGAYQKNMLWNGQFGATGVNTNTEALWPSGTPIATNFLGYEGLEVQAIAGLGVHRLKIDKAFLDETGYTALFDLAFGGVSEEDRYTSEYAGQAIAAYERTVLSNEAPFQEYLKGDINALSEQEKRGAILFFDKAECNTCHTGPALNSMEFYALGMKGLDESNDVVFKSLPEDGAHLGRGSFTKNEKDNYKFKVPQLYNLSDSPFYGHGSSFRTIREVVEYKNTAQTENPRVPSEQLAGAFQPLNLSIDEVDDLTAFLTHSLRDPNLIRYQPDDLPTGNCTPVNDNLGKNDLGCN